MSNKVFRRRETKYILTSNQYDILLNKIKDHIVEDEYFKSTICNVYYDTSNSDLIIHSLEKPMYKEKVRVRSYSIPKMKDIIYLEIKKKYNGVVSKRRIDIKLSDFYKYLENHKLFNKNKQIASEIDYCFNYYKLEPKIYLAYDRLSYIDKDNSDFRITFDSNIRSRYDNLRLEYGDEGKLLFDDGTVIMETKSLCDYPLWFVKVLSELKIYPQSFSKYGSIYIKDYMEVE